MCGRLGFDEGVHTYTFFVLKQNKKIHKTLNLQQPFK